MSAGNGSTKYFFNDEVISKKNSSTYVFDVDFSDTYTSDSELWLYLGMTEREMTDLSSNMLDNGYNFWNSSGIGIHVTNNNNTGLQTTTVFGTIYIPSYISVMGGLYEADMEYYRYDSITNRYYRFTEYQIGDRITDACYVINMEDMDNCCNIYRSASYADIDWERGRNIMKVDYISLEDDALISIRLYQYYYDITTSRYVTDFVWQEYFRTDFYKTDSETPAPISTNSVKTIIDNAKYIGFGIGSSTVKLYSQTTCTYDMAEFDLSATSYSGIESNGFKYGYKNSTNAGGNDYIEGVFTDGYSTVSSPLNFDGWFNYLSTSSGVYYALSDAYNVPHAYTGNAVSLTFTMDPTSDTSNFFWYMASSTPYIGNFDVDSYLRQRGLAVLCIEGDIYFEFYKYNKEYSRQILNLPLAEGFTFADGAEHTITVIVDEMCPEYIATKHEDLLKQTQVPESETVDNFTALTMATQLGKEQDGIPARGFYLVKVIIDGKLTTCVCPYLNDLSGVLDSHADSGSDPEIGDKTVDRFFMQGVYYTGIRTEGKMTITDYCAYSVPVDKN